MRHRFFRPAAALAVVLLAGCRPTGGEDPSALPGAATSFLATSVSAPTGGQGARTAASAPRDRAPAQIRGLYVNASTAGSPARLRELLDLAGRTEINTFVVDVKTEEGAHYPSALPLAREMAGSGAGGGDWLSPLVDTLHAHGLYAMARVVVFKDLRLSKAKPEWSIRTPAGGIWIDKAGNTWVSPWDREVWEYNLSIAEEAARAGFDEVQFDYVRFPEPYRSLPDQVHPEAEGADRSDAIAAFLNEAKRRLHPLGVVVAADVFGMSMNSADDVGIGQQWERISAVADHVLPMVYPSHYFPTHLPGVARPSRMPYETISVAVGMGVIRNDRLRAAGATPARIIPWLQAFDAPWVDADFPYGPEQARRQIEAVHDLGLEDWILWHPGSSYERYEPALQRRTGSRARLHEPPPSLVARMDRYEGWGMREARARAVGSGGPEAPAPPTASSNTD